MTVKNSEAQPQYVNLLEKEGTYFTSQQDRALVGSIIKVFTTHDIMECLLNCVQQWQCFSVNYGRSLDTNRMHRCELNNSTSYEGGSLPFMRSPGTTYYVLEKKSAISSCKNNGTWIMDENKSLCNCTVPYSGKHCEEFHPMTCKHVQGSSTKQDGEYDLYLLWPNNNRTAKIFCADMNSDTPLEYITLIAGKSNNFARKFNHITRAKEETSFEKVRLNVLDMSIVKNDYRFATTTAPGVYTEFGSAGDCVSAGCYSSNRIGMFNIDLSGTSFHLPQTIPYSFYGYPACTLKLFDPVMDANRQRWSAKCGGYCNVCTPHAIYLEFNKSQATFSPLNAR